MDSSNDVAAWPRVITPQTSSLEGTMTSSEWPDGHGSETDSETDSETEDESSATCFLFYKCAFLIEEDLTELVWNRATLLTLSAMFTFNLAVIKHNMGLVDADLEELTGARNLYCLAMRFLSTAKTCYPSKPFIDATLLEAAVCNNLGHIFGFFGDSQGIISCRDALYSRLNASFLEPDDESFFKRSLVESSTCTGSSLPPAA